MTQVELTVNGETVTVAAREDALLLEVLREQLHLMGPRFGCGQGGCGACSVLVDGNPTHSCDLPVGMLAGRPVVTVEGLGEWASQRGKPPGGAGSALPDGELHPLQLACLECDAFQCAYCASGILVTAAALLDAEPDASPERVKRALDGNLCRCGSHPRVLRAVRALQEGRLTRPEPPARSVGAGMPSGVARPRWPGSPSLDPGTEVGTWIGILPDGTVEVRSGKAELGQGIGLALAQVVSEELGVDLARIRVVPPTTAVGPDESYTAGSLSVQHSGAALRAVAAETRARLISAAAEHLGCAVGELSVTAGVVTARDGRSVGYGALAADALAGAVVSGEAPAGPRSGIIGSSPHRPDLRAKLTGGPAYVHDLLAEGGLVGRVVRPPGPGAELLEVDPRAAESVDGVAVVVRDGSFLGVVAEGSAAARRGAELLARRARWGEVRPLPDPRRLDGWLRSAAATTSVVHRSGPGGGDAAAGPGADTVTAAFGRPFLSHASIGPSAAVACWAPDGPDGPALRVWTHSQGIHPLRRALAAALRLAEGDLEVIHAPGAGCYGHNGADDAAYDAVLLARAVAGRPVQVIWSREDEMAWSPLAPAMAVEIRATSGPDGRVAGWRHEIWSNGHSGRPWSPGHPPLLAELHQQPPAPEVASGDPPLAVGGGSTRNAVPGYRFGSVEVVSHVLQEMPLRTSAMRALGAHLNVYAIESVLDELAARQGADPLEFRLRHLEDPRARRVLETAAQAGGWGGPLPAGTTGRGLGWARYKGTGAYCAVCAEVEAEAEVAVLRLVVAADLGEVINPSGAAAQLEGGALQAMSWTVHEEVRYDRSGVTSRSWEDYPVLTFSAVPDVEVILVAGGDQPPLGAGEAAAGPTAAAIGNALAAALGTPVRRLPLTPASVAEQLLGSDRR